MHSHPEISALLQTYFDGLFEGDVEKLKNAFHPQAYLFGDVRGAGYQISLEQFLKNVAGRQSPRDKGEEFRMRTLDVEVTNKIARVKAQCPMLGLNYIDFLGLFHDGERWWITSKLFTHVDP